MDALYHQTSQLIQEASDLFHQLEKDVNNAESIENAIQTKINAINAQCEKLDVLVFKTPINSRPMAKMRVDQLKYDNKHIQASLNNAQNRRRRREQELAEREQLLSRRFGPGHDHTVTVDFLAQEQLSLQNSNRNVDEMLHTECEYRNVVSDHLSTLISSCLHIAQFLVLPPQHKASPSSLLADNSNMNETTINYFISSNILQTLRYNRDTLKGAHKRLIDLANTLGLSNATISLIERRVAQDKYVLLGGMFITVAVIVLVIIYLT